MATVIWSKRAKTERRKGHKGHTYRAYPVIGHIKLIYYYSSSTKTVRIADIWDTRRKPEALTNRIK